MSDMLTITVRAMGQRRRLLSDWSVPLPPEQSHGGEPWTLRRLITRIVVETVEAFRKRQTDNRFVRVLTERQIAEQAERGKIDAGGRDLIQPVDDEAAVGTALQAFEDGLYLVIIDSVEQRDLDAEVHVRPGSQITFLRLVMLAGS